MSREEGSGPDSWQTGYHGNGGGGGGGGSGARGREQANPYSLPAPYNPHSEITVSPELLRASAGLGPPGAAEGSGNKGKGKKKDGEAEVKGEEGVKIDDGIPRSGRACLACRKLKVSSGEELPGVTGARGES